MLRCKICENALNSDSDDESSDTGLCDDCYEQSIDIDDNDGSPPDPGRERWCCD